MLKAPFPWFGGKSRVAHLIWDRFGQTVNYVEPFAGSLAVLLSRPGGAGKNETVNDKDCYLANFFRALQSDPEQVAHWADWPVNEADLHARHRWLVDRTEFRDRMLSRPEYFDAKIAGWWVWGLSLRIGGGWCAHPEWNERPAREQSAMEWVHAVHKKRPTLKGGGTGVHRAAYAAEPWRPRPTLKGSGITRQLPNISGDQGASGRGIHAQYTANLLDYFSALATRLRRTRVCCGDWKRVLGPSATTTIGLTSVFLDPPYSVEDRDDVYNQDSKSLAQEVFAWAVENGSNPRLRVAICGYEGEHTCPSDWTCVAWEANGGYGNQSVESRGRSNAGRERIWFSPHCGRREKRKQRRTSGKRNQHHE